MKRRLELTWVGKEDRPRLEPRLLVEEDRWGDPAAEPNLLIQGDNLLALKALEADYAGKVKCVYIDPPFNTGSAFEHYDDGLEHSVWLSMIRNRLEIIPARAKADSRGDSQWGRAVIHDGKQAGVFHGGGDRASRRFQR